MILTDSAKMLVHLPYCLRTLWFMELRNILQHLRALHPGLIHSRNCLAHEAIVMNSSYEDTLLVRKHSEDWDLGTFLCWVERCEMNWNDVTLINLAPISLQMLQTIIGNKHHLLWHNIPQLMPCSPLRSCTRPLGQCKSALGCCPWWKLWWTNYPANLKSIIADVPALRTTRCELNIEYETMKTVEAQDLAWALQYLFSL